MKLLVDAEKFFSGSVMEGEKIYRSKRINDIREMIINATPTICSDRAVLTTESYRQNESEPPVMKRAKALSHILSNINISVYERELIVGNVGSLPRSAQIFPEFAVDWLIDELNGDPVRPDQRSGDRFLISPEDEAALRGIYSYKTTRFDRGPIGGIWQPSTSSVSANVSYGFCTGATPDGRRAGEALADTSSPMHSTDVNGPTASLKSVGKLPTVLVSGGQLLNMRIAPSSLENPVAKKKLMSMLRTFLGDMKGMHIQFNVVSADTLRAAQEKPEEYKDLMVRVAGYSALFAPLDVSLQNDIIARTENTL